MSEFVDSLEFTNVKIDSDNSDKVSWVIDFTLKNDFDFYVIIKKNSKWDSVIRHYFKEDNTCPFCNEDDEIESTTTCQELTDHFEEVKNFLLNHPKIRLRMLFA